MALQQDPSHTHAIVSAAALTKWRGVSRTRTLPAAGASIRGVAQWTPAAIGDSVTLADSGIALVQYAATTTEGQALGVDATGQFVPYTTGVIVGYCIDPAAVAGYIGRAWLTGA